MPKIQSRMILPDIIVLGGAPVVGAWLGAALHIDFFFSLLVFLGVPALYLSFRNPRHVKKAALFSACTVPLVAVVDYVSHLTRTWLVPYSSFPRLFGFVTLEVLGWAFLYAYLVVMFYETFLDRQEHRVRKRDSRLKYYAFLWAAVLLIFLLFFFVFPSGLYVSYWYLKFGIALAAIVFFQFALYPKVFWRMAKTVPYFAYLCAWYELTALKEGWWLFPGREFIGWVYVLGVGFPLEELLLFFVFLSIAILSYYEVVVGDEK